MKSKSTTEQMTPLRAIKLYCKSCAGNSSAELRMCPIPTCPLYPFRFGNNPYKKKRSFTPDEKRQIANRLRTGRKRKTELIEYSEEELGGGDDQQ